MFLLRAEAAQLKGPMLLILYRATICSAVLRVIEITLR
jgi:hypothetical protein